MTWRYLFWFGPVAAVLAGCGGAMLHSVGPSSDGGLRATAEAYEDYLLTYEPLYFALSVDGRYFYYTFCTKNCLREINAKTYAIDFCNIYATWTKGRVAANPMGHENACKIFAARGVVIWDGPLEGPIGRYAE